METKSAEISDCGDVVCPYCNTNIITPHGLNPHTGVYECMELTNGFGDCPRCAKQFYITDDAALKHNKIHFPEDYNER